MFTGDDLLKGAGMFDSAAIDPAWIIVDPDANNLPSAYDVTL